MAGSYGAAGMALDSGLYYNEYHSPEAAQEQRQQAFSGRGGAFGSGVGSTWSCG